MIERAIKIVQRTLRNCISQNEEVNVYVYTKILSHLVNSWIEVRLLKLINESGAYVKSQEKNILECNSLERRWQLALDFAFCKAYKINSIKKTNKELIPYTARIQRQALLDLVNKDLLDSNELRNRIAHGQWKYAFTSNYLRINGELTKSLKEENILKIQFRLAMFKSLAQIIHDLAVSKPTFERDFNNNYKVIEEQKRNSHDVDYAEYERRMVSKRIKGLEKKSKLLKKHQKK